MTHTRTPLVEPNDNGQQREIESNARRKSEERRTTIMETCIQFTMVYRSLRTQTVTACCTYAVQKSLRLISTTATFVGNTSARRPVQMSQTSRMQHWHEAQRKENKLCRRIVVERLSRQRTALAHTIVQPLTQCDLHAAAPAVAHVHNLFISPNK